MAETQNPFNESVAEVAHLRQRAAALAAEKKAAMRVWELEHDKLLSDIAETANSLARAEEGLRGAIIDAYTESGGENKRPHPALGVRITSALEYDKALALEWALRHSFALSLDVKTFEIMAKAGAKGTEFVARVEKPTATIAQDLTAYLEQD